MALTTDERPRARAERMDAAAGPAPSPPMAAQDASPPLLSAQATATPFVFPSRRRRRVGGFAVFAAPSPASSVAGYEAIASSPSLVLGSHPLPHAIARRRTEGQAGQSYFVVKRIFDVVATLVLMTVFAPLLLLIGLAISLEDGGPMLYYQTRIGRNGVPFRFYKFRSMVRNADALKDALIEDGGNEAQGGVIFKMKRDPRVTRVGRLLRKYSLDELPQFLNVLKGEMSLVGPRPHLPREVQAYKDAAYHKRNAVTPGLLCLREVQGRSNLSFEQWIALDLLYIEHQGLRTDLWILLRALPAVLRAEGAY